MGPIRPQKYTYKYVYIHRREREREREPAKNVEFDAKKTVSLWCLETIRDFEENKRKRSPKRKMKMKMMMMKKKKNMESIKEEYVCAEEGIPCSAQAQRQRQRQRHRERALRR